jgi:hypothetical protein
MYKRFSVEVIQLQKFAHRLALARLSKVAVMIIIKCCNDFPTLAQKLFLDQSFPLIKDQQKETV